MMGGKAQTSLLFRDYFSDALGAGAVVGTKTSDGNDTRGGNDAICGTARTKPRYGILGSLNYIGLEHK